MIKPTINLFPHNQQTFDKVKEILKNDNRCAIIQPTGSGKTYLILSIMYEYIANSNCIVLAPSNHILDQIELKSNGYLPNTTLMTYKALSMKSTEEMSLINPKLIVLDEMHRVGAQEWGKAVNKLIELFPDAIVFGASATPIRHMDARNMAEELFGNNIAVNMSLSDAIVKSILPMPKYISALYTIDEEILNLETKVNNSRNDDSSKNDLLNQVKEMKNNLDKSKGIPVILKKHLKDIQGGKFIVFCKDKKHLLEMKSTVIGWFEKAKLGNEIEEYSVFTGLSGNNRKLNEFRNNKNTKNVRLLFSINKLNEGLHVDDITGVILLRATTSNIIYFQQIGRAIQAGDNTKQPIIFDLVNNFDNVGSGMLVSELKESVEREKQEREENGDIFDIPEFIIHDEIKEIKDMFFDLESRLIGYHEDWDVIFERYKNGDYDENDMRMKKWIYKQRSSFRSSQLSQDRIEKLNSINFIWNELEDNWNKNYNLLKDYYELKGNCLIPARYEINGSKLGRWADKQKTDYNKGELAQDRLDKLNSINFIWDASEEKWNKNYELLKKYFTQNGNSKVSIKHEIDGIKLGIWVNNQRVEHKKGKLSKERIDKLTQLEFTWDNNLLLEDIWNKNYELLKKFYKKNKNSSLSSYKIDGVKLGMWADSQRTLYKKGKLSKERIDKLTQLEFTWDQLDENWNKNYNLLKDYYIQNGNSLVNSDYEVKGVKLGMWVNSQRANFKKERLSKERIDKLNNINFVWNASVYCGKGRNKVKIIQQQISNLNSNYTLKPEISITDHQQQEQNEYANV